MNVDLEKRAIEVLRNFEPQEPYWVCYSGGKDSDCVRILADLSGVNYELHNNHTGVDTPTTVYYIREVMSKYGEKKSIRDKDGNLVYQYGEKGFIHIPKKTMFQLIPEKLMPPTRIARYCCASLKESGGKGRLCVTGVRKSESVNRAKNSELVQISGKPKTTQKIAESEGVDYRISKSGTMLLNMDNGEHRRIVEHCYRTTKTVVNPIIDWTEEDVWEFLHHYGCESNPEYKNGSSRVGCIGCPMAGSKGMKEKFDKYPRYKHAYISAFERLLRERERRVKPNYKPEENLNWKDGESVYRWWIGEDMSQMRFEDYIGTEFDIMGD